MQEFQEIRIVKGSSNPNNTIFYDPQFLTIGIGASVNWVNNDDSLHTVTSLTDDGSKPSGEFDSGIIPSGQWSSHVFNNVGIFNYYCVIHPYMTGQITVK
jgi:plastocyanin